MARSRGWPIAVVPVGELSTGSGVFRTQGKLHGLVIVKAAFRLLPGQRAELGPAPKLHRHDAHYDKSPLRSVRAPTDLVPFRERCDVWLTGHCYAPAGQSLQTATTRLGLYRDNEWLVDKVLHVLGDRPTPGAAPAPFQRLALDYERAYGGIGVLDNPVGVGAKPGDRLPNVLDPTDPHKPAGYGPLARYWRAKKFGLSDDTRAALDQRISEIPDPFDWSYFQCAPRDQQTPPLRGDEWLLLEGMHPAATQLQCGLPAVQAEARLWSRAANRTHAGLPIPLVADDLGIDVDAQLLTVCWRGSFPLPSLDLLASIWVGAALGPCGQPIDWAPAWARAGSVAPDLHGLGATAEDEQALSLGATAFVSPEEVTVRLASASPLPFIAARQAPAGATAASSQEQRRAAPALPWERPRPLPAARLAPAMPQTPRTDRGRPQDAPPAAPPAAAGPAWLAPLPAPARARRAEAPPAPPPAVAGPAWVAAPSPPAAPVPPPPAPWPPPSVPTTAAAGEPERLPAAAAPEPPREAPGGQDTAAPIGPVPRGQRVAIPIVAPGSLVVVTLPWQIRPPKDSLTIVVKGTCDLVADGPAVLRAEGDVPVGDLYQDDDPDKSLAYGSELAIFKPRADVVLMGSAYAPGGPKATATATQVELRFGSSSAGFVRRATVTGDRRLQKSLLSSSPTAPEPFHALPLTWERAFGGPGLEANPWGTGHRAQPGPDGIIRLPNIEDPGRSVASAGDNAKPVCFAPVGMKWKERWSKLGTYDRRWFKLRWPYFPEDFDWSFYQIAPPEQQLPFLTGSERFSFVGLRPEAPRFEGRLPGIRVRCFLQLTAAAGGEWREVPLALDTVSFLTDELAVALVWRGTVDVSDDEAPEIDAIFVLPEELKAPPLSLEAARARYLEAATPKPPEQASPEAEAPSPAPTPPVAAEATAEEDARAAVRQQLLEAGVPESALVEVAHEPPPPPEPDAVAAQLRSAGASEEQIAGLLAALAPAPEDGPSAPTPLPLRELVKARLASGETFDDLDLGGADLSDLDFTGRSLERTLLKGANLARSVLAEAKLGGAVLAGADLSDARLTAADLTGADLTAVQAPRADFTGATLEDTELGGADLAGAIFDQAKGSATQLTGCKLKGAQFRGVALSDADFTRSELDDAVFEAASLPQARLYDVRGKDVSFKGATMPGARVEGAKLIHSNFANLTAPGSVWEHAVLNESTFHGAVLTGASFARASCLRAIFSAADLVEARFLRAKLGGAAFLRANLMMATFERADLVLADLRGANLHAAETWKANLEHAKLDQAIVTQTKLA